MAKSSRSAAHLAGARSFHSSRSAAASVDATVSASVAASFQAAARACLTLYGQRQRHAGLFDAQSISHSSDDASSGCSSPGW